MSVPTQTDDRRQFLTAPRRSVLAAGLAAAAVGAADEPLASPDEQPPHLRLSAPPKKRVRFAIVGLGELAW